MIDETAVVNWDVGCGVCAGQCPSEAMSLVRDEGKGIPLDVRLLVGETRRKGKVEHAASLLRLAAL